jgi:hypothetical protein
MASDEIEHLYEAFSRYGRPRQLEGCPCCTSPTQAEPLVRKPLRTLSGAELEHYALKALTTWGTLDDYKYFIPRILELTDDGNLFCDIEITFDKFQYGDFRDWPANEQEAVRDFIVCAWRETVQPFDTFRADAIICGAARLLEDVTPLLDYADTFAPAFKSAYAAEHSNQTKRKLLNSFWDDSSPNYQRVLSWLYPNPTNAG